MERRLLLRVKWTVLCGKVVQIRCKVCEIVLKNGIKKSSADVLLGAYLLMMDVAAMGD